MLLLVLGGHANAVEKAAKAQPALNSIHLTLGHYGEHLAAVQKIFKSPCEDNQDYYQNNNQVAMESLLFCQALVAAGYRPIIKVKPYPIQHRLNLEINKGNIVSAGLTFWSHQHNKTYSYQSQALVAKGQFEKGLYVLAGNKQLQAISDLSNIRQLVGVTNRTWVNDLSAHQCIGSPTISAPSFPQMFRMIAAGRADYLLTTFSTQADLVQDHHGVKLKPIKNVKVVFDESLHFLVSKKHPQGTELAEALNIGLTKLNNAGTIQHAYQAVGFYLDKVKDWQIIPCQQQ
ncbi:substrate-binding periplasmic protein [Catenovulum sp. SX2]|uniref:substrate-binding periplasmic protein n=1 Tax=Catenovulum sp. SX2 TaxID=3398614 RepID=UPI003F8520D1